ncbi:CASP-like protein 1D1 [Typha latifolia]|uniref:CASP-like protein 1D1 n=1 Tax=Typha latifolia TaxID=4733 RepID=UPI003C2DC034
MASTEMTPTTDSGKTLPESGYAPTPTSPPNYFRVDFILRLVLLAASVSALVVLVTGKQTKIFATGLQPPFPTSISRDAKFNYSPALMKLLIEFELRILRTTRNLVALAVTVLYSIITAITSCSLISSPAPSTKTLFHLILFDALMAAIMASATGATGAIAYLGLKGNSHTSWTKICNIYGKFCRQIGSSAAVSLVASIVLLVLVVVTSYSLFRRSR